MYSRLTGLWGKSQDKLREQYERQQDTGETWHRVYKTACVLCGEVFFTQNSRAIYCSDTCKYRANTIRQAARKRMDHDKVCGICGASFTAKRGDAKYCSAACKQKAYRVTIRHSRSVDAMQSRNKGAI